MVNLSIFVVTFEKKADGSAKFVTKVKTVGDGRVSIPEGMYIQMKEAANSFFRGETKPKEIPDETELNHMRTRCAKVRASLGKCTKV
ncbi:MAG: hypothetical protein K9M10_01450 [Candidatus Pacebacteria bacterium]|nr:hypothetical protein [Candidatus Paceibacterota bacterium]MCF7857129.1 hypothetical protein [Candidatus Paceibacterota bacterium]